MITVIIKYCNHCSNYKILKNCKHNINRKSRATLLQYSKILVFIVLIEYSILLILYSINTMNTVVPENTFCLFVHPVCQVCLRE